MRNIKMTLSYDGTAYHGFQDQGPGIPTIQRSLETAIHKLTGERLRVTGAGRTDAGVHALGQVINIRTSGSIPVERWPYALNAVLPQDIVVRDARVVHPDFHAQYWARKKRYRYTIDNGPVPCVFRRRYAYRVYHALDVEAMAEAASLLEGRHDFAAFRSVGSGVESTVRTLYELRVERCGDMIQITACADGFLYNMMRIIVGTLLEVGKSKRPPKWVKEVLMSRQRHLAGPTVPGLGLCLMEVIYDDDADQHSNDSAR
ncbi:MAG: tRNA pseudouridine(38-40) synthase TruA [Firmicutes bacterium]|nr:tRNA pseudouridine(38-40) synthase TruA [Bacillota bacterium]